MTRTMDREAAVSMAPAKKEYEKPELTEVQLQTEEAVLGACYTVATGCNAYQY